MEVINFMLPESMMSRKWCKFKDIFSNDGSIDDLIEELQNVTLKQQRLKIEEIENKLALLNINKDKDYVTKRNGKLINLNAYL